MSATSVSTATATRPTSRRVAPPAPPRPRLRVVVEAKPRHTLPFALLFVALAGATIFGAVSLNAFAAQSAVQARELDNEVVRAERDYARLVAEVGSLEDPARIRQVATEQLGMVPARGARFLVLDRHLPSDDVRTETAVGGTADPLKPLLSQDR